MSGSYDDGYSRCECFWGTEPGRLVKSFVEHEPNIDGWRVLDAGCGEGKNAVFLAKLGAVVDAVDISEAALQNGKRLWHDELRVRWKVADMRHLPLAANDYDLIVAYGLLHCFDDWQKISIAIARFQMATRPGGYNIICAMNARHQELEPAHAGFRPTLVPHSSYAALYSSWDMLECSDSDLVEAHPHNKIRHRHSMTRLLARKVHP